MKKGDERELKSLKNLLVDAKGRDIKVVSALIKKCWKGTSSYFDKNEGSVTERINELTEIQNARIQVAYKKLFAKSRIEHFIHADLVSIAISCKIDMQMKSIAPTGQIFEIHAHLHGILL
ncbi:uncharacterized protein LOC132272966 [Cornus florida]|uniref:uncharacterized protein LOC132272966 n=1 Tax=Cornus florida TaxID=4283 RepID=UPI00289F3D24|nr:uncharacterized protein LOC132272966 [Cornus florida]